MDPEIEKTFQELIQFYSTTCQNEAKILREAVEEGDIVPIFNALLKDALLPRKNINEKLVHLSRLFYYMGYCLKYNNGIPFIKILNNVIDNSNKEKVINAVKSQKILVEFLIDNGVDIESLKDFVLENEMIEYAIDEEKKSTGVLIRILKRKQLSLKNSITQKQPAKIKKTTLSVPDWCIIFYYIDEAGTKAGYKIDRIEKFIKDNNVVNRSGILTTRSSFKKECNEIENRINDKNNKKPLPPERIEKILPYLKNYKIAMQNAVSDISYLNDEIEENKRNTY